MQEFIEILTIDRQISSKEALLKQYKAQIDVAMLNLTRELGIEELKSEIDALKIQLDEALVTGASMFDGVKKVEWEGYEFKIKKGSPSVKMKENVDLAKIPTKFVRTKLEPDKVAIRQAPLEEIESFASIEFSPDKVTYKLV